MAANKTSLLCETEDSVLVVIDIQTRLTKVMPGKVLARLQRYTTLLLKAANTLNLPVFATEQYPKGLGELEPEIVKLLKGNCKRYEKTAFSCLGADQFLEDLATSDRKQVVLTGMEAHVCVMQTAMDLVKLDYQVFLVEDAVCSRYRECYETALNRMRQAGVTIVNAESVVFEWLRDAKHPHFKSLQSLIRT